MEEPIVFQDSAGHRIAGILTSPLAGTDRVAVLCHGFLSHKNSTTNGTLTRLLAERGVATLRFDVFGHGDSQGPFEDLLLATALDQVRSALHLVHRRGYRRIGLVGSSFGGLISILVAAEQPALQVLALKCPVVDFPEVLRLEFGDAGMEHWKRFHEIPDVTGRHDPIRLHFRLYEDCLAYDAYKAAESVRCPVLVVQGDADELVPLHQSRRLVQVVRPGAHLEMLHGADHGFTKAEDFRTMTVLITTWLAKHL